MDQATQYEFAHGFVAEGYEAVKELFEKNLKTGRDENAQLCVYVEGELVVDLWSERDGFTGDSLVNIFSSSKSITAIAVASLVGAGLLSYDDRISLHWPEFGAHGKSDITLAQLLRHEAGLPFLEKSVPRHSLLTDNIKQNEIGRIVEAEDLHWRLDREPRQYHSLTRGWVANEVFRRVHPDKITIGEFIRREISSKLKVDIYLGLKEEELERVSDVKMSSWVRPLVTDLLPRSLGRADDLHLVSLGRVVWREVRRSRTGSRPAPAIEGMGPADPLVFNCPEVRRGEVPSAGVHGTGRGLARLASIMSRGGGDQDGELLSPPAWDQLHSDPVVGDMTFHTNTFTRGGLADFRPAPGDGTIDKIFYERREGFYGWYGFGGSVLQWNPELQIGFAFVPTLLSWSDIANNKAGEFQEIVMRIVREKKREEKR